MNLTKNRNRAWKETEELKLIRLVKKHGHHWTKFEKLMCHRSASFIKNRYYGNILKNPKYQHLLKEA